MVYIMMLCVFFSNRGIEWTSLTSFLSFATSTPNNLGLVRNELQLVDLPTGRSIAFRGERGSDEPAIEMIKVSHLKQYLAVIFKDKPLELWDIRTCTLLREMSKSFPTITALEWSPSHNLKSLRKKQLATREAMARQTVVSDTEQSSLESSVISLLQEAESKSELSQNISAREHFVFTDTDGQVYHLTVEGNTVKDSARIPPDGSMGSITCIAWKGDILVLGDVDGNLNFWDLKARVSRGIPTHRGWVRKIRFAPGKGNQKLIAMYNDGAEVWDTKEVQMVSSLRSGRNVNFRVLDVDWCTSDKVILASDDGCIRVLEMTMKSACFRMDEQELSEPVWCPYLLVPRASLALKAFLLHQPWNNKYSLDISDINYPENENVKVLMQEQLHSLSNDIKKLLFDPEFTLLQRCLLVSRLYGDESELHFWTVAAHYLHTFSQEKALTVKAEGNISQENWINPLDICYDILCENSYFQKFQLERVNLQEVKRSNYDHTRKCTDQLLLLGQTDRAVQLLLETSAENPYYYCDSLKACLVTTVTSSGPSQSTIKLVATNMIANGKLAEGVQLLCLIDKAADACRYLQTYGEWNRAAWLAKVRLNAEECADVLKRWVDHLCSPQINQKSKAILVLLSLGCFMRVAEMLHSMRYFDRAALFVEACLKYGTIDVNEDAKKLIHAVFADYARSLKTLGFKQAATLFASKAGAAGKDLLNELEQLKEGLKE
uniref:WD repeat-containing protein 11 n=1 Tax=Varanus komodoensis TaxID=61221 RepID=A0A8D2J8X0_VARKO